ncbi:MAG: phosphoribosylamine--glycine ligase, partial [Myxococcales bacterium]|nr:phosphoribosylamine--glycine ligase [Myxococcales bacterium]
MEQRFRVMVVGGGGREHALIWRLLASPSVAHLVATAPNPGFPERVHVDPASEIDAIVAVARRHQVDLVVVGPEAPLAAGLADAVEGAGIPCFGPRAAAAALETSKAFAKDVMRAAGVPTATALVIDPSDPGQLLAAEERCRRGRVVLKADGLAAGKGVVVCREADEALEALRTMSRFGDAAKRVLLEDLLEGPEVSLFALSDGERTVALPSAQDHKTLLDGGRGPNTGGMGAYAPCPLVDPETAGAWVEQLHQPVVDELARRGTPFRGVLFAGLMLTEDGPRVLEYNVRFG